MKFKIEVAEIVNKGGHDHLHLIITAEDGWQGEEHYLLQDSLYITGELGRYTYEESRAMYSNYMAAFARGMIDEHIREKEQVEPLIVKPRILAVLLEGNYDFE